jgi:hypothetical protein
MVTTDVLRNSIHHTHEYLAARFDDASAMVNTPGQPRKGYEHIDTFLALASKHLNAVDAALLPAVRKHLPDGGQVVHDYLRSAKQLELALAHVKAREYGSVLEAKRSWRSVWSDVGNALAAHRRSEEQLSERLSTGMPAPALDEITERLHRAEVAAPSRPHPYAPHTGVFGLAARRFLHAVDSFWDTVEGRMAPEPVRPPHKSPGPMTQYLLADPHFDEENPPPSPG